MKIFKRIILILFLLLVLIYVTNITSIPNNIVLFKGEKLELGTVFGVYVDDNIKNYETIQTGAMVSGERVSEKTKVSLKLFNLINVKEIEIDTIPKASVIPLGNSARVKTLYKWGISSWND